MKQIVSSAESSCLSTPQYIGELIKELELQKESLIADLNSEKFKNSIEKDDILNEITKKEKQIHACRKKIKLPLD